ncbi:MAG: RecX family transcriptional regulator, partial [Lachnospiraceae bacterium]|nr:RecX family transcriptional regulator [Lachnospiraceae bacterium]
MEIYKIEDHKKNKKLVYLEEDTPAFSLYSKEIKQFDLKAGEELTPEKYDEILEILSKRARERCLYLLDDMARTEQQLRRKLAEGFYPEEAADYAIAYCKDKHYIDDEEYARRYIELK